MSAHVSAYLDAEDVPRFEDGRLILTPGVDVWITEPDALRSLALTLLAEADRRDGEAEASQAALRASLEMVGEIRREKGQIADDGMCWACKVDDHSGHRDYAEGRCAGCGCEVISTEPSPAQR